MTRLVSLPSPSFPSLIAGARAQRRFLEFFASVIRNPHIRRAYVRAVGEFLDWCEVAAGVPSLLDVQDRLIGKYLKRWGFTPQRPVKRALEQRPEQVAKWLNETYPALVAKARAENAAIHFGDETAVREDANWVRGYAPKGRTPVLAVPTRWVKLSMSSAISPRGEVAFRIVDGTINAERFIEFLAVLIEGAPRKIILVVDNLRVHHAKAVTEWLADKADRIELAFLPPYNPEANPDEYLNHDFKTALRLGPVSPDRDSLLEKALAFMNRLTTWPERVRAYFQHPEARYAASLI